MNSRERAIECWEMIQANMNSTLHCNTELTGPGEITQPRLVSMEDNLILGKNVGISYNSLKIRNNLGNRKQLCWKGVR